MRDGIQYLMFVVAAENGNNHMHDCEQYTLTSG